MSSQATVLSVDALKAFRGALALFSEDTLAALGAVDSEVRRTVLWLEQNRPAYWHEQIKRRREEVSMAKAEVFRRRIQKRPDYTPAMSEQVENLRKAEASLQDAEKRLTLVRKWQPRFQHAMLEYHATVQRLKDLAASDIPNAALLLGRIVESIEAYLAVQPPSGTGLGGEPGAGRASPEMEAIASRTIAEEIERLEVAERARAEERARAVDAPVAVPAEIASEATEEPDASHPA
ncbi:MAG: hypothetical protein ACYC61_06065 [Isosphaeraceae bacterium]